MKKTELKFIVTRDKENGEVEVVLDHLMHSNNSTYSDTIAAITLDQ